MEKLKKILLMGTGALALIGASAIAWNLLADYSPKEKKIPDYFATVPVFPSGMTMTTGDFNNDGNLDLIVGTQVNAWGSTAGLYFFKGDGEGHFTLVKPEK